VPFSTSRITPATWRRLVPRRWLRRGCGGGAGGDRGGGFGRGLERFIVLRHGLVLGGVDLPTSRRIQEDRGTSPDIATEKNTSRQREAFQSEADGFADFFARIQELVGIQSAPS